MNSYFFFGFDISKTLLCYIYVTFDPMIGLYGINKSYLNFYLSISSVTKSFQQEYIFNAI